MTQVNETMAAKSVVVGVDGSAPALAALKKAALVVKAIGAKIVVVFVHQMPVLGSDPSTGVAITYAEEALADIEAEANADAKAVLDGTGIAWSFERREGDPAHELIEVAHAIDASAVIVGSNTHGAISSVLFSSVAEHLLHHCDVSLIIVRPEHVDAEAS